MSRSAHPGKRSEWLDRLGRFVRSQLSVSQFCRRERVSVASFYRWRAKLNGSSSSPSVERLPTRESFVPVRVAPAADVHVRFPNGTRLTLPAHDYELVRLSIESLAQLPASQGDA